MTKIFLHYVTSPHCCEKIPEFVCLITTCLIVFLLSTLMSITKEERLAGWGYKHAHSPLSCLDWV